MAKKTADDKSSASSSSASGSSSDGSSSSSSSGSESRHVGTLNVRRRDKDVKCFHERQLIISMKGQLILTPLHEGCLSWSRSPPPVEQNKGAKDATPMEEDLPPPPRREAAPKEDIRVKADKDAQTEKKDAKPSAEPMAVDKDPRAKASRSVHQL